MARPRPTSLRHRAALAAMASAALGGLTAAAVAISAVDWLIADQADRRLSAAATTLAGELDEERKEQNDSLEEILEDENGEIVTSGIRLALYQRRALIAGDAWVPPVAGERCITRGELGSRVRACGRSYGDHTIVAAELRDEKALSLSYLLAGGAALVVAAALGGLLSLWFTRWALAPLFSLTRRIEALEPENPRPEALGEPLGIDEVDAIHSALHDAFARLREQLLRLERFAADAAHELRTPLTLLRGELELLAEDSRDADTRARLTSTAARAKRLAELTESLLFLAMPLELADVQRETISLSEIVHEVVTELPVEQRSRIEYATDAEGLVLGDATLLRVIVRNALDNALKFSRETVQVEIAEGSEVVLSVRDRGVGIDPDLRERVFQRFFRVRADATPGHGLGLALIGHVARAHGGHAELGSVPVGTQLVIRIPAWRASAGPVDSSTGSLLG